jgi:hypothetical protein
MLIKLRFWSLITINEGERLGDAKELNLLQNGAKNG